MRVIYIADDGTTFDDEWDCKDYEFRRSLSLDDIEVYDENGNKLDDILSEDAYNNCTRVIVKTDKAVSDLHKIVKYTGFICYYDIDSPGIWHTKIDDRFTCFFKKEETKWPTTLVKTRKFGSGSTEQTRGSIISSPQTSKVGKAKNPPELWKKYLGGKVK